MELRNICVLGGGGFVGRHIVHRLVAMGCTVCVPTRNRERVKPLLLLPTVDVIDADIHDTGQLAQLVRGMDAVINLVGVLHDARGERGFEQAHVELTRKAIAACRAGGVRRYIHMSALGADVGGPSRYLSSKGAAEKLVRASSLHWTIFRPSVIFGREDRFLNLFADMLTVLPVIFLGSPNARFQPVFVEDVGAAVVQSLTDLGAHGKSYDLCGPRAYTLRELVALVGATSGHRRPIIGLPDSLSLLQAAALTPTRLLTLDNYRSMKVDNVSDAKFPFGIEPASLESVVPGYLGGDFPRARYQAYRGRALRAPTR
jgi:uncharacterized protein YbjT (DUF2867 family)